MKLICTSSTIPPPDVCLEVEKLNPLSLEYDACLERHNEMTKGDYLYKYNYCMSGQVGILREETFDLEYFRIKNKGCEMSDDLMSFKRKDYNCLLDETYDFSFYVRKII